MQRKMASWYWKRKDEKSITRQLQILLDDLGPKAENYILALRDLLFCLRRTVGNLKRDGAPTMYVWDYGIRMEN